MSTNGQGNCATRPGRGGLRPGSGRKKGSRNRRSVELLEQVEAADLELPLPRLLRRMNDPSLPENYRDGLAATIAPYLHARFAPSTREDRVPDPALMTDEELELFVQKAQLAALKEEARPLPHLRRVK